MHEVLHKSVTGRLGAFMSIRLEPRRGARILFCFLTLVVADLKFVPAHAQGYPSGPGGIPSVTGSGGRTQQQEEIPSAPAEVKPEKAAAKAYASGTKTMVKARELEDTIAKATDPDKKAKAVSKLEDTYGRALEQFTEVLRNKNDMYDAWNQIGYVHLRFGAYRESIDDFNHGLKLKPDVLEAVEYRGEAYLGIDHLDEAKATYMDLFFHARPLADRLMVAMQAWLKNHQVAATGVRATDVESFDKWVQERDGIAKTTAAN
jgi:tetratricopeptide (TPR) repeat protein